MYALADLDLAALRLAAQRADLPDWFPNDPPKVVLSLLDRIADLEMDLKYARFGGIMKMDNEIVRLQNRIEDLTKKPDPSYFCERMDQWAETAILQEGNLTPDFAKAWSTVRLAIRKSCLLDRLFYGGERPSQTPCPVHKGKWAGCHFQWPGRVWVDAKGVQTPVAVPAMLQEWYDAGCRCAYHRCGCTTGWNPDEHCGCGGEETWRAEMAKRASV